MGQNIKGSALSLNIYIYVCVCVYFKQAIFSLSGWDLNLVNNLIYLK